MRQPHPLSIAVDEKRRVSGLLQVPSAARVCYVLAHGAGAGMSHPFMAAVALLPGLPVVAGGKSFGGRMTSQAQSASPLPGVQGLVLLGFPLHPPGHQSDERGAHLFEIKVPMLFFTGDS